MHWYLFAKNYQEPFNAEFIESLKKFQPAYDLMVSFYEHDFVMIVQNHSAGDAAISLDRQYRLARHELEKDDCSLRR